MSWNSIFLVPKQKNRRILFVQWSGNIPIQEYLADDYQCALHFRAMEMKHSFTHWMYITPPFSKKEQKIVELCTHSMCRNPKEHIENKCRLCGKPYKK